MRGGKRLLGGLVMLVALAAPSAAPAAGLVPSVGELFFNADRYRGADITYVSTLGAESLTLTGHPGGDIALVNAHGVMTSSQSQCSALLTTATCSFADGIWAFKARLGSGDDDFTNVDDIYSEVEGEAGSDTLIGGSGPDWLFGGPGSDVVRGGAGDDWVSGLGNFPTDGPDTIDGGPGNDRVDGIDGIRETIVCGDGTDLARVDPIDVVVGCETVQYTW